MNKKTQGLLFLFIFLAFGELKAQTPYQPNFIDRIHRHFYKSISPYRYLYNKFWAVDSNPNSFKKKKEDDFIVLPFVSYAPETNFKFGLASDYSFYTHFDSITRVSSQTARISYSLNHQYGIELNPDFWTPYNRYHFTGAFQYQNFPANFYGIGYDTRDSNKVLLASHQFFLDLEAEKKIGTSFRIGLVLNTVHNQFNFPSNQAFFFKNPNLYAEKGGTSFFTGISLIYDTRNILNFTTRGTYLKLIFSQNIPGISDLNSMNQLNFLAVRYFSWNSKSILGFNLVSNNILGKNIPFYLLNQLGGSNLERGYYQGRFRDKSLLAGQIEYKYHFIPRLALGVFAGLGTTFGYEKFSWQEFKPSIGGGIHYIFSIPNQLSLRLDYGIGEKPLGENRFHGAYFSLSEAF